MKITSSNLDLYASHQFESRRRQQESLQIWRDGEPASQLSLENQAPGRLRSMISVVASQQRQPVSLQLSSTAQASQPVLAVADGEEELTEMAELEISLLRLLVERLAGKEIKVVKPADLKAEQQTVAAELKDPNRAEAGSGGEGWGLIYHSYESHYESESSEFQATGLVQTADGRTIEISLQLRMSREFFSEESFTLRAGDALKDPLVVNFSGTATELTQDTFSFDIDADGRADQIHFVTPEGGFLALDKNRDGKINDGSELFGPASGDGFAELSAYDQDGNQWIDESDEIFARLRVWSKDSSGNDRLLALGAHNIGAVYLGHIETPFEIKDAGNNLQAVIRDSGLYLEEDGSAGSIQQIDLVV